MLGNEVETYDSICYEIGNDDLKPNAPWGFAVYRTCYSDESSWRKMRQHIETCIQDTVGHPLHHVRRTLRSRHQVTFIEDKQSLGSAGPVEVKVHFDTWARQELARNWKERSETPEVGLFPYGGPPSPKQMMFYGARYNVCMVIDDVCLQSVDETRKHTGPVALLLKREWQPIRFREGEDVHPDYEDGWMIDHDEGPNGWIYVRASNYVQQYNDLNEWYNDWDEDHMFMYPITPLALRWNEFNATRTLYVHSLHLKYGPVVRIAPNEVSFTSYEAVKEIYGSLGSGYDKSSFYNLFRVFKRRTMFSTLEKRDHAKRKRIIADRYANSNVVKPTALSGIEKRAKEFVRQCGEHTKTSMDVYISLHAYACDCITHHLFHPYGTNSLQKKEDLDMMHQVTSDDSLRSRLVQHHYPVFYQYFSKLLDLFLDPRTTPLAQDFVIGATSKIDPAPFTLLNRLQDKTESSSSVNQLDSTDIAAESMDHMVAGIDTTGDSLCFLMWELSQPSSLEFQKKLQNEIRENPDVSFDKLSYLDAVVQEGLRCFPAIPMSLPRVVPHGGKQIDGFFVPEGSIVSSQAYSVHRNNDGVFPNPDVFNPERWMSTTGEAERKRHMFAFSHGGRGCVGKHLALAEMKLLLRDIYGQFTTVPDMSMTVESMRSHDQVISARPLGQRCLLRFVPLEEEKIE
ncbi:putative sterigmatocystin biosynthesis P450 monooxygenase STCB [Colletotrichum fructicola]|nr:putative sterigmatocystin biosynthesis P450 monooxygenase STCB [Colletotrichum fructicola]